MNTTILKQLSLLSQALSKPLHTQLLNYLERRYPKYESFKNLQLLNVYAAFIFSQGKLNYSGIEILNDENTFKAHTDQFIGFFYCESNNLSLASKRNLAFRLHRMMCDLAKANHIHITPQSIGVEKINDYVQHCIESYQSLERNEEKLTYLNGWSVTSQERKAVLVDLDFLYVKYKQAFTDKIHDTLNRYGLTQKTKSLRGNLFKIKSLLETTSTLDMKATVESFELLLSEKYVQSTFYKAYQLQFSECLVKGNDPVYFNKAFNDSLDIYTSVFINTKLYPAPLKAFIAPIILNVKNPPSFSTGGKTSELEKMRWFADIPLHIKDEQAIAVIEARIERDINILKTVFTTHFNQLKQRQERNKRFIDKGIVKPIKGNSGPRKGSNTGSKAYAIGEHHLDNTIATFYKYGISGYKGYQYGVFLGFEGKNEQLIEELNLSTNATLFTLTALLVIEHPKITPSWLQKLQLFNENGKLTGYKKVGEQFILTSEKARRGRNLAQQDVILNEFSKSIVDFIVQHTQIARQHLKAIGDPNWKFLLLTCTLNKAVNPSVQSQLYNPLPLVRKRLNDKAALPLEYDVSAQELDIIASITTHRTIRRHRGLQIYLKTRSQSAVADALGHKEVNQDLLDTYLPKPLMDFFTERVIRQFQKAIIFEAMKKSPYLLDAVNMTYQELEEFLENHGLNDLPDLNAATFDKAASQQAEQSIFDSVVLTVTVPIFQLLMSIKTIIDNDNDASRFNELVQHWYQSATYLFKCIEMPGFDDDDILDMYEEAKKSPLDHTIIEGVLSC
ncbi:MULTISPECIES: hypothetical protein [unclassified Photobacterium]|uniref:hypothetical protein n=1 Tax=unclassified Photobacterium TaxID=2628852 RepID=UPI000D1761BE|nr:MULTISPECIES: hypothetical protein [unclassified Photobacterium]PSV41330.1 hypothetical protein C9J46_18745 [Photobacterium sp. GB-36]PSW73702.1 hypothetical protein C9J41_10870 [Photobacterium sp. GB-50]